MPDADGYIRNLEPNEYGHANVRSEHIDADSPVNWWVVRAPNGACCSLDPKIHTLTEHPDGTLTVTPSILIPKDGPVQWHGYLVAGEFREA